MCKEKKKTETEETEKNKNNISIYNNGIFDPEDHKLVLFYNEHCVAEIDVSEVIKDNGFTFIDELNTSIFNVVKENLEEYFTYVQKVKERKMPTLGRWKQ